MVALDGVYTVGKSGKAKFHRDPAPSGYLIIGGGRVGRMIAQTLAVNDVRVVIADSDWDHISQARMDGIETYFGNPISDHADRYLDLSGIGNLISLSGRANFDVLTAMHFKREFGSEHLYELRLQRKASKMVSTESASACGVNTCLERT
jgi:voltage-gated potassium channel Kch